MRMRNARRALAALAALVITTGLSAALVRAAGGNLVIKGSDTLVMLSQAWAEEYMKRHPEANIAVTGGGSGTGIAALINGTTDLANCSRAMKASEIAKCKDRGFVPAAHAVALDGLAIAVHAANPVPGLSLDQLRGIYTGKITDWQQVGGKPGKILVLSRESNSGTYVYFRDFVLRGRNYRSDALLMPSTKAIQQEITGNRNAIGYGGLAYFKGKPNVKVLPVSMKGKAPVYPGDDNVRSGAYPIARPLYIYSKGKPGGLAADFIRFCLSKEGQDLVGRVGYVALRK
ncbi:MAG: phosphate ABC transporter substrate-binding protein [Armatimonadetes bacterium]|nr:phosphate ABC transporter substrate-binding protein [Armatimonadota bacterium]